MNKSVITCDEVIEPYYKETQGVKSNLNEKINK